MFIESTEREGREEWKREREREKRKKNVERNKSPVHLLNIDSNPFEIGFEMRRE